MHDWIQQDTPTTTTKEVKSLRYRIMHIVARYAKEIDTKGRQQTTTNCFSSTWKVLTMEDFPSEIVARIFKFLTIPEQIKAGSLNRHYQGNCPVSVLSQYQQLENVRNVPEFGFYSWGVLGENYEGLRLVVSRSSIGRQRSEHVWVDAEVSLDRAVGNLAPSVFFRFKMQRLRPNGGYCSLMLSRPGGDPRCLEIKFDFHKLRGYGGEVTTEDFGINVNTVKAEKWLHLFAQFDWESREVRLSVDGKLIKILLLNDGGWNGIHSIRFRGYTWPRQRHAQAWSHVYVERR